MAPLPPVSKHGTLNDNDIEGAVAIDLERIVNHTQSANMVRHFGKPGAFPPSDARAVDRRYVSVWKLRSEAGEDFVGLTKTNSAKLGRFEVANLVPGEYKISLKLDKQLNANPVTDMTGSVLGGLKSLTARSDTQGDVLARGMPNHYMEVRLTASTPHFALMDQQFEMDVGNSNVATRSFVVHERDMPVTLTIKCISYSLVKRLKLSGELLRCDLEPPKFTPAYVGPPSDKASLGRDLVQRAFSSASLAVTEPVVKAPRSVHLDANVDLEVLLTRFYGEVAPEKISDIPKVIAHFLNRDKHPGVLLATLEDKYRYKFKPNGEFVRQ